ncbi:hypothetical protein OS493_000910 [Desmophyllum pertusum]|uniref:DNA 3'-5' helicase n=1 Tax=Desmophyllum pertusum TaxID=174260 RepID=A0A9W9ZTJ1_9CNID|nr:hypothetical protein OS493_000910 [Desmophyllum pertusum]
MDPDEPMLANTSQCAVAEPNDVGIGSNLDEVLDNTLHHYFDYPNFRPLQKDIIKSTLSGKNVIGIAGTGSGKSLTFMLPAVLGIHPTVVVMPTKSLIDDILMRCLDLNITSCKFTGTVSKEIQRVQLENFNSFKLIFTTPEMIEGDFLAKIENSNLERVDFDEAHTISSWEVRERSSGSKFYDDLSSYIKNHEGCGIVYCVFTSDVANIHSELIKRDISCVKYHGHLSEDVKALNFSKWNTGEVRIMVANSAFGMGIDKANVRFVVHARVPTGIDDYYQQCDRAGRDGQPAKCCMYYSHTDTTALLKMFKHHDQFENQSKVLNDLIIFLEDPVQCRHRKIMSYYGEERDGFTCGTSCDNCQNSERYVTTDGTADALKVVQAVVQLTEKKITSNMLKLYLAGSSQKCIQDLDSFSSFGCLKKHFVPVVLMQKFLHLLIYFEVFAVTSIFRSNSISITVGLGPNAHKLIDYSFYVPKYEKV